MIKVVPLSSNYDSMDIGLLRELANKLSKIDLSTESPDERKKFVVVSRFKNNVSDHKSLDESHPILRHFVYGFVVLADFNDTVCIVRDFNEISLTPVATSSQADVTLMTASLDKWQELILRLSVPNSDVLAIVNQIQNHLEKQGLSFLFKGYIKEPYEENYILK